MQEQRCPKCGKQGLYFDEGSNSLRCRNCNYSEPILRVNE